MRGGAWSAILLALQVWIQNKCLDYTVVDAEVHVVSEKIARRLKCKLHVYKVCGCEPGVLFWVFFGSSRQMVEVTAG